MPLPPITDATLTDEGLPEALRQAFVIAGLGPRFHYAGALAIAGAEPRVGIVGTREPGSQSVTAIEALTTSLAMQHALIVSGTARGTDMAAHGAALEAGGRTVGFLPRGLEDVDWDNWRREFARLPSLERLLLVSPFPRRQPVTRQTPVIRNRLIAALAEALVVGEAQLQSGTHTCTRMALEFGVPVFLLTDPADPDRQLALGHRELQSRGAVGFTQDDAFGSALPARILAAAAAHRRRRAEENAAQLKLF